MFDYLIFIMFKKGNFFNNFSLSYTKNKTIKRKGRAMILNRTTAPIIGITSPIKTKRISTKNKEKQHKVFSLRVNGL